jgi:hypothetical protein
LCRLLAAGCRASRGVGSHQAALLMAGRTPEPEQLCAAACCA